MAKAIGMIEYMTVSVGIDATDTMLKTSEVELIEAQVVCPGKYIALIEGDLSAVRAAVDSAKKKCGEKLIDSFVLGNPHEALYGAMMGAPEIDSMQALGIIETYSAASAIVAADTAAKTAIVELLEMRLAVGMCGKSYVLITGGVAAVEAAVDTVKKQIQDSAMLLDCAVIANPSPDLAQSIF